MVKLKRLIQNKFIVFVMTLFLCSVLCGCTKSTDASQDVDMSQATTIEISLGEVDTDKETKTQEKVEPTKPQEVTEETEKVEETESTEDMQVEDKPDEPIVDTNPSDECVGAWVVYWDQETVDAELADYAGKLNTLCHFAAYFAIDRSVFIPEETTKLHNQVVGMDGYSNVCHYLTIVNDLVLESGSSLKDTDLLYQLFSSPDSMQAHVNQIVQLAVAGGYQGIEIDYENIRKDMNLWSKFIEFEQCLIQTCKEQNLSVRIVLEPATPIKDLSFPANAEYVMMCYNLYGYGTKPGPKADVAFLNEMVDKMELLPGPINFALATGGFDFAKDGSVSQVTYRQALDLKNRYSAEAMRDEGSGALHFEYDDNGHHEVWYADQETIHLWMNVIKNRGHNKFTIWRLGGNK